MAPKDRRSLTEGLTPEPEIDPERARNFVYQKPAAPAASAPQGKPQTTERLADAPANPSNQSTLVALTARIPAEKFKALKRASFERQLQGVEPNSMQDIVEEALTPWLRKHGYLP